MKPIMGEQSVCYKISEKYDYTPEPYDRAFNATKMIWTEMCLSFLLGVDILTMVSLSMLSYFQKSSAYDSKDMVTTLCSLGTAIPVLVAFNAIVYYRVATNHFPAWRKLIQDAFHWSLTLLIIFLGLAGVYAAIQNALITKFKELRFWVRGYFLALIFYIFFFLGTLFLDLYVFYKI